MDIPKLKFIKVMLLAIYKGILTDSIRKYNWLIINIIFIQLRMFFYDCATVALNKTITTAKKKRLNWLNLIMKQ